MTGAQGCCRGGARGWGAGRGGHWGGLPPRARVYVVFSPGGVGHCAPNLHLRLTLLTFSSSNHRLKSVFDRAEKWYTLGHQL